MPSTAAHGFAQVRLFMHLVLPSPLADPWQVALRKGWAACELIRKGWGEDLFWRVWEHSTKDGPLIGICWCGAVRSASSQ